MLRVRLSARADRAAAVERALLDTPGLERVASTPAAGDDGAVLEADLRLDAADDLVATLNRLGVPHDDFVLSHLELVAPVAAMLSFETRASAAVGVAIWVTTIPASAYWGVALGTGQESGAAGALLVLGVNVCLLIVSGSATLLVQRRLSRRAGAGAEA